MKRFAESPENEVDRILEELDPQYEKSWLVITEVMAAFDIPRNEIERSIQLNLIDWKTKRQKKH